MHHIAIQRRRRAILGKQRDLFGLLTALVKRFDRLAPCRSLVVVDLSQMQHMPLHRAPGGHTAVFNDAPIAVLLAVLAANLADTSWSGLEPAETFGGREACSASRSKLSLR